ncbi:MAG: cyclic-di-AMP receptor [Ardenticatenaceae bacterium]|nr:cyclic-di-AMP receptor [Ardenticatenaceae bacterium]
MKTNHKMVMAVIPRDEATRVVEALVDTGLTATTVESRGGVLRQAQHILYIAVNELQLEEVLTLIKENCRHEAAVSGEPEAFTIGSRAVTAELGGAVVFVWDLEQINSY